MSGLSASAPAAARNCAQTILQTLARMPLGDIADAIGKDESTACRVRSGEARLTVMELGALLDAAAKKIVGSNQVCVEREKYEAVMTLFAAAFSDRATTQRLIWENAS